MATLKPIAFGLLTGTALFLLVWNSDKAPEKSSHTLVTLPLPEALKPGDLSLFISADKEVYAIGEQPRITARLINNSDQSLLLVPALTGSDMGRFPEVLFTVTPPLGAAPRKKLALCGTHVPMRFADFQIVGPQEMLVVCDELGFFTLADLDRGPGEYALTLRYSTAAPSVDSWYVMEAEIPLLEPILAKVPPMTITSNVLKIKFEEISQASLKL